MKARAKSVLPVPRSPRSATTSPGRASAATRRASAAVAASSGRSIMRSTIESGAAARRILAGCSGRECGRQWAAIPMGEPILHRRKGPSMLGPFEAGSSMAAEHRTDICIIGAGPVGLFAVFECGMLKMHCHVVDALDMTGGQCAALYPEKPIYDIPGYPAIDAVELIAKLEHQAAPFHPVYHLGRRVEQLSPRGDGNGAGEGWLVRLDDGSKIAARAVIIAAGVGAFGPNKPPLPGIEQYEGRGVFYLVKRREDFRGRRIVIAGGGDSAVDWAISLAEVAEAVYMVHRRPKFRAAPESVTRMEALAKAGKIEMVVPYQL